MAKSSRFSIEGRISMVDKITRPLKRAANSASGFSAKMRRQFQRAGFAVDKFQRKLKNIGMRGLQIGMAGLAIGLGIVTRQFVQFDDAIFQAAAKFSDLNLSTKEGQKTMERLRETARKVGETTKFNAVEAAQGLDFLALAGFNTEQAMSALPGVVSLATVANIDLATATDIATDSLGAFNLASKDAKKLQENLTRVNDVFAKTTASSNTNLTDLFESVKKGGPTFTSAGQSIETFSALIGTMANSGVKGAESGTQLRNMMLRLVNATGPAKSVMSQLGVNIKDSQGNFRDAIDIIADFEKGLKGAGTAQRTQMLATVFGARAVTGMNILLANGSDKLREFRDQLLNSKGAANEMAKTIEQSLGNKLKSLASAATELGFKFLEAFDQNARGGIDGLTQSIRDFDPTPIIQGLKAIGYVLWGLYKVIEIVTWPLRKLGQFAGWAIAEITNPKIEEAIIKRPDLLYEQSRAGGKFMGKRIQGPQQFSSPESSTITRNNNTTQKNTLDVNVNAPNGTSVDPTGQGWGSYMKLNMGVAN